MPNEWRFSTLFGKQKSVVFRENCGVFAKVRTQEFRKSVWSWSEIFIRDKKKSMEVVWNTEALVQCGGAPGTSVAAFESCTSWVHLFKILTSLIFFHFLEGPFNSSLHYVSFLVKCDFEFETHLSEWGNWHNRHDFRVWEWGIRWISRDFFVEVL